MYTSKKMKASETENTSIYSAASVISRISWQAMLALACVLLACLPLSAQMTEREDYFYVIDKSSGLADNHVLQMLQLANGQMIIKTSKGINLYGPSGFRFLPLRPGDAQPLDGYSGQSHLYVDKMNRLWIKDYKTVCAIDLKSFRCVPHPLRAISTEQVRDIYIDSRHDIWSVEDSSLIHADTKTRLSLRSEWGELQDVDVDADHVYAFCAKGIVAAFSQQGKLSYVLHAFAPDSTARYSGTSLVVKTQGGLFYQIRTGSDHCSAFLRFDPSKRSYAPIFTCPYTLHTLNMPSDRQALISSQRGYLVFDFLTGDTPREVTRLALPDGTSLTTGINTVYRDTDGGIWLGTYSNGIIYVSPLLGLFFTIDKPWWQGSWGIVAAAALLIAIGAVVVMWHRKKRTVASSTEPSCSETSAETPAGVVPSDEINGGDMTSGEEEACPTAAEADLQTSSACFLNRLLDLINQHIADGSYGVEELAHDMCMERTGLYKKLTAITDESPVSYIRNVRLAKAAEMLRSSADRATVNEIAERTGFSSPSYFTKCFKARYGVKPSEYK